ncbi:hypothetical protein [cf. Phormidesmis sp. LEGE 11477]|uniref:hypothetical protein n=1 Tax=cf. Phormidesmis sp. LEGE 11477 TaxID=1828680 RepID=UPI00187F8AB6|nr:hypothetical protein [cf. Phormidesmis sp. LEGE 11477]MBE9059837.1 hypothetical protein [cf. Phormidesmis sp. LEGE 11477]
MQKQLGQLLLDKLFLDKLLVTYEIQEGDYSRLFELMGKYQDRPIDLADASLALATERTGVRQIPTLDSGFLFYRIGNQDTFDIIPVQ